MGLTGQPTQSDDILGAIQRFINGYNQKTEGTKNDLVLLKKGKLDKKSGKQKRCKTGSKRCGKACIKKQYKCSANKKKRAAEEQEPSRPGPRR